MGCIVCDTQPLASSGSLIAQTTRLKFVSEHQSKKLDGQLQKLERMLVEQFSKPQKQRSAKLQRSMIFGNIRFLGQKTIYLYILDECKKIIERKNLLDSLEEFKVIKPSIDLIVYCSSFLGNEDVTKFARTVRSRYPNYTFPIDSDIKQQLIKNYKSAKQPDFSFEKDYIFQLSSNNQITVDQINIIGHNYKYEATSYQR